VGIVGEIERKLAQLRAKEGDSGPVLRTSTMTHLVWAPPAWLPKARATLAGLHDSHPARTIFLVPEPKRTRAITAKTSLHAVQVDGEREAHAEVIEIRLCGDSVAHPASIVLPLLISDLPVFCRWRGEPEWESPQLAELMGVVDRFVVNSDEWRDLPGAYDSVASFFGKTAVSDIAYSATVAWRARLAELWPGIGQAERIRVEGPKAQALLISGWLRSRLRREIAFSQRGAEALRAIHVDRKAVEPPLGKPPTGSDLLSAELDMFGRDPVYEASVRAAV
jgi:glucose-6-phosphate dehydrogenase assembly protein OpcA